MRVRETPHCEKHCTAVPHVGVYAHATQHANPSLFQGLIEDNFDEISIPKIPRCIYLVNHVTLQLSSATDWAICTTIYSAPVCVTV